MSVVLNILTIEILGLGLNNDLSIWCGIVNLWSHKHDYNIVKGLWTCSNIGVVSDK